MKVHDIFTTSKNTSAVFLTICHETVNLTVILNFIGVKMTMNCEYDSVVGVILPVEYKILPIVHLKLKLTKTPAFLHFLPKTQRLCFC